MAFERVSDNIHRLNENIKDFAKSSAEYYKLELFNKTMKGATAAVKGVAIAFFLVFAILFLSLAVSVALSTWIDIPSSGFFIVGGLYLLIGLYIIFFGSSLINGVMLSKASKKFFKEPDNDSEKVRSEYYDPAPGEVEKSIPDDDERI